LRGPSPHQPLTILSLIKKFKTIKIFYIEINITLIIDEFVGRERAEKEAKHYGYFYIVKR
jgi:hypothetical protein